jgi:hypothetical protein
VARREKLDRALNVRLDELETAIFRLKVQYDKYFNGIDKLEPLRERDEVKHMIRSLLQDPIQSTIQRYRFRQLRARANIMDLYVQRNLVLIERGTHPKFNFRANLKERQEREMRERMERTRDAARERADRQRREDAAFRQIFDKYTEARNRCGQSDLEYESVRKALRQQVRNIKGRYKCQSVSFKVAIEDGKARLKAIPKR